MSPEETTLLLIRGAIASEPEEFQKEVHGIADKIRESYKGKGQAGLLALALVGAEAQNDATS